VGTGKTTLLHALLAQLDRSTLAAFVFNPRLEPLDFFRVLFDELGIETPCATKAEYLIALNRFLIARLEQDLPTLLIIDEAQNLSTEMLEEVRLLSNLETPSSKLLQIMLVGQPELAEMLARPELRQLRQRIVMRHSLRPFTREETATYVQERLRIAGYTGAELFDKRGLRALHEVTGGVPRLVNVVCDGALLLGFGRGLQRLGAGEILEVARDLELEPRRAPNEEKSSPPAAVAAAAPLAERAGGWFGWLRRRQTGGA
jgi:general secretion pathway protein A